MIPGKPHPTPNEKIWVAAYTDDRTEYVELRTVCPDGKAPYQRLWHKEQPLGMAIADFLYDDLQPLDGHTVDTTVMTARVLYKEGSYEKAVSYYEALLKYFLKDKYT